MNSQGPNVVQLPQNDSRQQIPHGKTLQTGRSIGFCLTAIELQVGKVATTHPLQCRVRQRVSFPLPVGRLGGKPRTPETLQRTGTAPATQQSADRSEHAYRIQRPRLGNKRDCKARRAENL